MTPGDTSIVAQESYLAFAGHGRDLLVRVGPEIDAVEFREAALIFLPRWRFVEIPGSDATDIVDIEVTFADHRFRIAAVSWDGGESIAADFNNAANALAWIRNQMMARPNMIVAGRWRRTGMRMDPGMRTTP